MLCVHFAVISISVGRVDHFLFKCRNLITRLNNQR